MQNNVSSSLESDLNEFSEMTDYHLYSIGKDTPSNVFDFSERKLSKIIDILESLYLTSDKGEKTESHQNLIKILELYKEGEVAISWSKGKLIKFIYPSVTDEHS